LQELTFFRILIRV